MVKVFCSATQSVKEAEAFDPVKEFGRNVTLLIHIEIPNSKELTKAKAKKEALRFIREDFIDYVALNFEEDQNIWGMSGSKISWVCGFELAPKSNIKHS